MSTKPTPWPPGFVAQPIDKAAARCPLRYMRSRQTALDKGLTGTMVDTFGPAASNVPDVAKARVALPKRGKA
jgi:hypothetical protein